jgi:hypothetical protein
VEGGPGACWAGFCPPFAHVYSSTYRDAPSKEYGDEDKFNIIAINSEKA